MTNKIYVVTDLGPGDGGKGGVVHKICKMSNAHTVIKVGGAQGSHGVCTSRGERFAFSQWGCGTLEGIKTHISSRMVVSPEGILNEANSLRYDLSVHNPFDLLTLDQTALCATPYHGIASRLKELARGENPRGTVGSGVGQAFRDSQRFPELAILAKDLSSPNLKERIAAVREQIQLDLLEVSQARFLKKDLDVAREETSLLHDDDFLEYVTQRFREVSLLTRIVDPLYLEVILRKDGAAVVESSHGILTDNLFGFFPHTSAIRTLPCFTHEMLKNAGYDGKVVNLGVTRAYAIRHGAGPLPTFNPEMTESLMPNSNKDENRYQGKVRVGPLDLTLLKYAIEVCGGQQAFDGLAVTWFDQIQANGVWYICDRYSGVLNPKFFTPQGGIKVWKGAEVDRQKYQEELGKQLFFCKPETKAIDTSVTIGKRELFKLCADKLQCELGVPVRMVGFGETDLDKVCL